MKLVVKVLTGREITLEVDGSELISAVKRMVEDKLDVPVEHQKLVYKGSTLSNASSLNDYKIVDNSKLHLFIKRIPTKSTPAETQALWTELRMFLNRHFNESDAEAVLKIFKEDFRSTLKELSLDDLERLGQYHLERNARTSSS